MGYGRFRRCKCSVHMFVILSATFSGLGLLLLTLKSIDDSSTDIHGPTTKLLQLHLSNSSFQAGDDDFESESEEPETETEKRDGSNNSCATVEEMGKVVDGGFWEESLRVRKLIHRHFALNGPSSIRNLPPEQFCRHGFVIGKASEAGFGNEMYKILTAAALSVMLNRSLIIGQTRGKYPFGDYISYSNVSFTLKEVKHLWRRNGCVTKYKRHLVMRSDDFVKPTQTSVLCSDWRKWEQPIIWFQNTTDAVAAQFFLKNIYPGMRNAASELFGKSEALQSRPNVFGELMRVLISPSEDVQKAVNWVLGSGVDPDISLHMRMLTSRSVRAVHAALSCLRKAMQNIKQLKRPRLVIVSDTPAIVQSVASNISEFADVVHFNYKLFKGNISREANNLNFRVKDWGPAPRWVAFVDYFLASRAKHAVVSGAQRRVGTTYAQLIAALAAAHSLGDNSTGSSFSFLSSFQSNLLRNGLRNQIGWGHVWNRFAGPLSCRNQPDQCGSTPLLPPAWWDGLWQSPIPRDIRRLAAYGIELSGLGTFPENSLQSFCNASRRKSVKTVMIL